MSTPAEKTTSLLDAQKAASEAAELIRERNRELKVLHTLPLLLSDFIHIKAWIEHTKKQKAPDTISTRDILVFLRTSRQIKFRESFLHALTCPPDIFLETIDWHLEIAFKYEMLKIVPIPEERRPLVFSNAASGAPNNKEKDPNARASNSADSSNCNRCVVS